MIYRAIGLMSGSSLDGLDIVFAEFEVTGEKWNFTIQCSDCYPYSKEWTEKLKTAPSLYAADYMQLHSDYGHLLGTMVNRFIHEHQLQFKVQLIASHGHTSFHSPSTKMTHQLGDGAAIAAETGVNVVSDLRAMDIALGGQGAPIVPIGEKLLFADYTYFLNIGGISNITAKTDPFVAFDICPANRVLNMLAETAGKAFDDGGKIASSGTIDETLLQKLNALDYYCKPFPKSLANEFGTGNVFSLIQNSGCSIPDALATYTEHIAIQIKYAVETIRLKSDNQKMLVTGGGALNTYLIKRMQHHLPAVEITVPGTELINYKEALIMALIGVLRWREENNVLSSVTGSSRNSIGGTVWMGLA
ncbi:MAG: anhydro-N-acetylmuramic acid kinase [Lacibacter sp.]